MPTIWPLPKVTITSLKDVDEKRPAALVTSDEDWSRVGHVLNLPLVVMAEPTDTSDELIDYLSDNLPSQVEVIYAVGNDIPLSVAKIVAHRNHLPLVVVPLALDSDHLFESFVEKLEDGLWKHVEAAPASELLVDWEVINAAPAHLRGVGIVDLLSILTALLDWRYAARHNRTRDQEKYSAWGASVAAGLASQAIKSAPAIGEGKIEGLRTLLDLLMMSVQLANAMGHDRHQEGTEHYFAFSMRNQGATAAHPELVAPGILLTAKLHGQDPQPIRDALVKAGVRLDQVRVGDAQLALGDLPNFCAVNDFAFSIAHEIDPQSDKVKEALKAAGFVTELDTGGWSPTVVDDTLPSAKSEGQQSAPTPSSEGDGSAAKTDGTSDADTNELPKQNAEGANKPPDNPSA